MNLILLEPAEVNEAGDAVLSGTRAAHMVRVLEVAQGDQVRIGILDGPHGTGTVQAITADGVRLRCTFEASVPPPPSVDLLLTLPRPKVLRRLWAQIAALGVGQIILTNAARVERNYFDTHVITPDCYRPLLIEGLQQARDTRLPRVTIHRRFKVLIEDTLDDLFGDGLRVVAHPHATRPAGVVVRERADGRVLLAIGPEGGWTEFELALLGAHGFTAAGMGPRTLRTDTACLALLALVHESMR